MLKLYDNEKILLVVHKHWVAFVSKLIVVFTLLITPIVLASLLLGIGQLGAELLPYIQFFSISYLMAIVLVSFIFWMDYYLDVWIITSERIIDVEQMGLFRRNVSEFDMDRVQDITIEVPNMLATFLHYGNVRVQTAGEQSFAIENVPHITKIKSVIMGEVTKNKHVGTQQVVADKA